MPRIAIATCVSVEVRNWSKKSTSGTFLNSSSSDPTVLPPPPVYRAEALFTNAPTPFVIPEIEFRAATAAPRNRDELGGAAAGIAPLRILFAHRETFGDGVKRPNKPAGSSHWLFRSLADQLVELLDGRTLLGGRPLRAGDIAVLCRTNGQLVAAARRCAWPVCRASRSAMRACSSRPKPSCWSNCCAPSLSRATRWRCASHWSRR
jgi:hypothetical protein